MTKTPIILLTKERPLQLEAMVKSIISKTKDYRLIICDNASTQQTMVDLLNSLEHDNIAEVIRHKENLIFEGFNAGLDRVDTEFFILSDPDIILPPTIHPNWISKFMDLMRYYSTPKVGVALSLNKLHQFKDKYPMAENFLRWEGNSWKNQFYCPIMPDLDLYGGMIDTTLAMYRRDTFEFWKEGTPLQFKTNHTHHKLISQLQYNKKYIMPPIRVGGSYTSEHTGWLAELEYPTDFTYYRHQLAKEQENIQKVASSIWMTNNYK